jgi:hypothetical protein
MKACGKMEGVNVSQEKQSWQKNNDNSIVLQVFDGGKKTLSFCWIGQRVL